MNSTTNCIAVVGYKDAKMQDGWSPDTSLGSPAAAARDDSAPGSPDGDYVPFAPLPWQSNATDGP
jgi:hypothetical protein